MGRSTQLTRTNTSLQPVSLSRKVSEIKTQCVVRNAANSAICPQSH